MPSRKKALGHARKAAKAEKAAAEAAEKSAAEAAEKAEATKKKETLEAQIKRLCGSDESCKHGYNFQDDECPNFVSDFLHAADGIALERNPYDEPTKFTRLKYPHVWTNVMKMKIIQSYFLAMAANCVLDGETEIAHRCASYGSYLKEIIDVIFLQTKAEMDSSKSPELLVCDEHTLVRFVQKNIPCSCLDEKYNQVKTTVEKMGICGNPSCHRPDRMMKRSDMMVCTRCKSEYYCSAICQQIRWPTHKQRCNETHKAKKEFKSGLDPSYLSDPSLEDAYMSKWKSEPERE